MYWLIGFFIIFIIALLVIIVSVLKKPKAKSCPIDTKINVDCTLDALIEIVKEEMEDVSKLNVALEKVFRGYPFPDNPKEANAHFKFVYYYAKNPLTTAKMIVQMQKTLAEANPQYKKQIEDFQMRGVDARKK